jgi:hypothetical protein
MMPDELAACLQRAIASWHGMALPSLAAERALADLVATIRSLEGVRDGLAFEDEPASFAATLRELAE